MGPGSIDTACQIRPFWGTSYFKLLSKLEDSEEKATEIAMAPSSSQPDLAVLRTAKLAMAEGLIEQSDFDVIKKAFLKAQQIKAGMDAGERHFSLIQQHCSAGLCPFPNLVSRVLPIQLSRRDAICARAAVPPAGFLREEDYMQARDSFLHSLDFQVHSATTAGPVSSPVTAGGAMRSSAMGPASAFTSSQHPQHHQSQHQQPAHHQHRPQQLAPPPPPLGSMPPPPPPGAGGGAANGGIGGTAAASSVAAAPGGQKSAPSSLGGLAVLAELPRIGKAGVAEGKVRRGFGEWEEGSDDACQPSSHCEGLHSEGWSKFDVGEGRKDGRSVTLFD